MCRHIYTHTHTMWRIMFSKAICIITWQSLCICELKALILLQESHWIFQRLLNQKRMYTSIIVSPERACTLTHIIDKRFREKFIKERTSLQQSIDVPLSQQLSLFHQHVNYIIHQHKQFKWEGTPVVSFHPQASPSSIINRILLRVSALHVYSVLQ